MRSLATLLLAQILLPQGTIVTGRVLDQDAKPVAGAEVVLLHRPLACPLDVEPAHRVLAKTDAAGMFHADLHQHCRYSARARWAGAASRIEEGVEAGSFFELRQDLLAAPLKIAVFGLEPYADRAPFRLQVSVGSEQFELASVPVQDGAAELPALPFLDARNAELVDRSGEMLWAAPLDKRFDLPPPRRVRLIICSADGKPVAGVEVRQRLRNYWYTQSQAIIDKERWRCLWPRLGTTGADGRLELQVPICGDAHSAPERLLLLASKPGLRTGLFGYFEGHAFEQITAIADGTVGGEEPELRATLTPIDSPTLLTGSTARPLDAAPVVVRWSVNLRLKTVGMGMPLVAECPWHDGLVLQAMPPGTIIENAWLPLPETQRSQLAERFGFWPPTGYQPLCPDRLADPDYAQFPIDNLIALRVVLADGRPAERIAVLATPPNGGSPVGVGRTDRIGRIVVPRGVRVSVVAENGCGTLQLPDASGDTPQLELRPLYLHTVHLRHADGTVAAGVVLNAMSFQPMPSDDGGSVPPHDLAFLLPGLPPVRSDAAGDLQLPLPACHGLLFLQTFTGASPLGAVQLAIDSDSKDLTVEVPANGK